jgi:CubicO group peptidase (beta-lactamase class C family)
MSSVFSLGFTLIITLLALSGGISKQTKELRGEKNMGKVESTIPDWVIFPEEEWIEITPAQAGFDVVKFNEITSNIRGASWEGEVHEGNNWGSALARGGYLVKTWGDPEYRYQTASLGKAFTRAVLGLAVDEGLVDPDEPINKTWLGEGQLSHPHKYLNVGHHKKLTWRHLIGAKDKYEHYGGFPVTNGFYWRKGSSAQSKGEAGKSVPEWAKWTGDPLYDNYSHAEPGTVATYSSGGLWRLSQALTALWDRDIKQVLDEKIFSYIGIPADRWDWLPGKVVHDTRDFYPHMPGYGEYLDPPYEINGHVVRGGPGWVLMSPRDLARFGLLVAARGIWNGKRLVSAEWTRSHAGGNRSWAGGSSITYVSIGKVTTDGLPSLKQFNELIIGEVDLSRQ